MVFIVVVVVAVLIGVYVQRGGRRAGWIRTAWASLRAYVVIAPATFFYLLIVTITTWVIASSSDPVGNLILVSRSSTLHVLLTVPFRGFVQSAFWIASVWELPVVIAYAFLLAPVERWLGTLRWLIVAITGHIVATLLVAMLISAAIAMGLSAGESTHGIDVGVSYAFGALAGIFSYRLRPPLRWIFPASLLSMLVLILIVQPTFTAVGHILAVLVGLSLGRLTRDDGPRSRSEGPIYPRLLWRD